MKVRKPGRGPNIPHSQIMWEPAAVFPVTAFSSLPNPFLSLNFVFGNFFFLHHRTFLKII